MVTKNILFLLFFVYIFPIISMKCILFQNMYNIKAKKHILPYMCNPNSNYLKMSNKVYQNFQWNLFKKSFNGNWNAPYTYIYNSDKTLVNILYNTNYNLTFYDNNTCIWKGKGLRFTEGIKQLYYNQTNLNQNGMVFLFSNCGGHSYRYFDKNKINKIIPIEVNFFHEGVRSMIIIYYIVNDNKKIELDSIQITPFRNNSEYKFIQSVKEIDDIVFHMTNNKWYAERFYYGPNERSYNKQILQQFNIFPYLSNDKNLIKATFEDGLIMIVPKIIPNNEHFKLLFGSLIDNNLYKQLIINYDINGNLTKWVYDTYTLQK